jgi:hypothetical protein
MGKFNSKNVAWVEGDLIVVSSPYKKELVDAMRSIPGRRWDAGHGVNTFPIKSGFVVKRLCENFGIVVEYGLTGEMNDGDPVAEEMISQFVDNLSVIGDEVFISFPYDPVKIFSVKSNVPGCSFDRERHVWKAPIQSIEQANVFGETYGLTYSEKFKQELIKATEHREFMVEASRATDADIDVPGIKLDCAPTKKPV